MTTGPGAFRFGVVATANGTGEQWRATARRVAALGYSSLLVPDGMHQRSPLPSLAMAAGITDLCVGTFVLAAPLRPAKAAAWEAHSLSVLTDGRFELGIGTGLPSAEQSARELGLPYGSAAERLAQVVDTIDHLQGMDGEGQHTPVLVAAGGPRARSVAAARADIVTLATHPLTGRRDVATMAADVRAQAGPRAGALELAMNLFVIGDHIPAGAERYIGADAATLIAHDSLVLLRGTTEQMVDELQRRRDLLGTSYITVNAAFSQQLAPVVERLTGC